MIELSESLVIRLILIILAGVRLQSKQDSHCESCFVFGLTPSLRLLRRKTKACAGATLQWW